MALRTSMMAVDIGRRRLQAVAAVRDGARVNVRRTLSTPVPADLDVDDHAAYGSWMRDRLREAGLSRGRAVLTVGREHVGLKRLNLPSTDPAELPDMVRLAMQRDLPFDAHDAVIDFVPIERHEQSTTVLAVAVPDSIIQWLRRIAKAAGLSIERIGLRTRGTAALLRTLGESTPGSVLAVDISPAVVEFAVFVDGAVRFSRAAELPEAGDPGEAGASAGEHDAAARADALADAVVTEARRTWMSYRITEDAYDVRSAVVMGPRAVAEAAVQPIGEMLHVPTTALREHASVNAVGRSNLDDLWPLAGALIEPAVAEELINFDDPRRPPDLAARRRRLWLAGAGAAMIVLAALVMFAQVRLIKLQRQADGLAERVSERAPDYYRYVRDNYRLAHLKYWSEAEVDWLAHLAAVVEATPPPDQLVFDSWTASLKFSGVEYDRRRKEWSVPKELQIVVDGEAADRATADAFRAAFVRSDLYKTESTGADARGGRRLPFGFTYRLRTPLVQLPGEPEERIADSASASAAEADGDARSGAAVTVSTKGGGR